MPSYVLSDSEKDFYKEAYICRLYKNGYPATLHLMMKFNKKFYQDHNLQGEKRGSVIRLLCDLRKSFEKTKSIRISKEKSELKGILSVVLADRQQKRGADDDQEDNSDQDDEHISSNNGNNDQEDDVELEKEQLINDLDDIMADKDGTIAVLENRNEELAITLKMKDEECQQLEEENRALKEALQKKQAQQLKNSDVAKFEENIRFLEEALQKKSKEQVQQLKNSNVAKLEEEVRTLREALQEKDQMLKTTLKVHDVLTSLINKPAPQ